MMISAHDEPSLYSPKCKRPYLPQSYYCDSVNEIPVYGENRVRVSSSKKGALPKGYVRVDLDFLKTPQTIHFKRKREPKAKKEKVMGPRKSRPRLNKAFAVPSTDATGRRNNRNFIDVTHAAPLKMEITT
jgi:hypothetical protein